MAGNVHTLAPAWKKGQSGNPSGINVPKEAQAQLVAARKLCMENAPKGVEKLLQLMECGKKDVELAATRDLLDRAGLKAVAIDVQQVETDENGDTKTFRVEFVKPDEPRSIP